MSTTGLASPLPSRVIGTSARRVTEVAGHVLVSLFVFFTCFTFLRPSPYDFLAIPTMILWFMLGIRLHRGATLFLSLLVFYELSLVLALLPYLSEPDPVLWTAQSVYLMVTAIFFVMFFSSQTSWRVELVLKAYLASCVFAAVAGIVSFVQDQSILFTMAGRAAGVFEDPNVLGSFLILGIFYLYRRLIVRDTRRPILSLGCLSLLLVALFLTFSRGAWLAAVVGATFLTILTFRTSSSAIRRRVSIATAAIGAIGLVLLVGLLSVDQVAEQFEERAQLSQDYDVGVTGRFGNQLRSIPMLLDRPAGFGPLRYRLTFHLEPHNSYIGGFANGGWLGGLAFLGLVLTTIVVGLRLCLRESPYRAQSQIVVSALLMCFLQAFQIDVDHWRHAYLMLGMVWGLECARLKWARHRPFRLELPPATFAPDPAPRAA